MPNTHIHAAGSAGYGIDEKKAHELDRDRTIPLTETLAALFALNANAALEQTKARALLTDGRAETFAQCITANAYFPFTATVQNGAVVMTPQRDKLGRPPVLKDISDGFTEVYKDLVRDSKVSEGFKYAFTQLFQPVLYDTYCAAGMPEGPHTKYTLRSC